MNPARRVRSDAIEALPLAVTAKTLGRELWHTSQVVTALGQEAVASAHAFCHCSMICM
jgi:hypothetical protein